MEELGEGAFGKVHRAILENVTFIKGPVALRSRRKSKRERIVAVKIMHGGLIYSLTDSENRKDKMGTQPW